MNRKAIIVAIGLLSIPILGIIFFAAQKNQDVRSKAAEEQSITIPTVVPAPKTLLNAPYMRLVSSPEKTYTAGDQIPIQIYVKSDTQQTVESRFVVIFDNSLLALDQKDIQNQQIYPVLNVESVVPGKAIFSVFVKDESGYGPITLSHEQNVVTMYFRVIGKGKGETPITLTVANTDETSSITGVSPVPVEIPPNILRSEEGTTVLLQ